MEEILENGLKCFEIDYSPREIEQFKTYADFLVEYNKNVNLTAITEIDQIYTKHFLDCVSILKYLKIEENSKVIDVGTGAGFPAVPVKILRPDIKITLLDSLKKRTVFLDELMKKLNIDDVEIIHSRAEELARDPKYRQQYDYCISRAVANLSTLLEYTSPYVKVEGFMAFLKGPKIDQEVQEAKTALRILNCKIERIIQTEIPGTDLRHNIVLVRKLGNTPKQYPRKSGTAKKQPLGA